MAVRTVADVVEKAPALTPEQIEILRGLLPPVRRSEENVPESKRQAS